MYFYQHFTILFFLPFLLQKNAKGQVLFDKICEKIELAEKDYFGLRYIDEKDGQVNGNIS